MQPGYHTALFQVVLAVNVRRVNVTYALSVTGPQQYDVGRNDLITGQMNDVTNMDVLPLLLNVTSLFPETSFDICQMYCHNWT